MQGYFERKTKLSGNCIGQLVIYLVILEEKMRIKSYSPVFRNSLFLG